MFDSLAREIQKSKILQIEAAPVQRTPSSDSSWLRNPGCIIFTFIAMDVLHPCIYLWTVGNKFTSDEAAKMTMLQKLSCSRWWKVKTGCVCVGRELWDIAMEGRSRGRQIRP